MPKRFVSIWFSCLVADWMERKNPDLKDTPFILSASERGRMVVKAANVTASSKGIYPGMVVADCRAVFPDITVLDYPEGKPEQLLQALAEWCIRFAPVIAIDSPDGIVMDCSGCTHLWEGETSYLAHVLSRLEAFGYHTQVAMADTIAAAWAVSRYGKNQTVVIPGGQKEVLLKLPSSALRIEQSIVERLEKLGLSRIGDFINMPRTSLRRRFGAGLLSRIDQALGHEIEVIRPVRPVDPYIERLPSLEPIRTAKGIELALEQLLEMLCGRLARECKGLRDAALRCYRVDGNIQQITIGTNRPTGNTTHLFKLFELKIQQLKPDLGFELFELHAKTVEDAPVEQDTFWNEKNKGDEAAVAELLDKISGRMGQQVIKRYLPAEHYWPERSYKQADSISQLPDTQWRTDLPRPVRILELPELIEVSAPIPDYPPMLFRYKGELHEVKKADGPERIEQEWWLRQDVFRDYYCVEDQHGKRYWLFRAGHYSDGKAEWYLHGFFA